jgi:hypothetical protein
MKSEITNELESAPTSSETAPLLLASFLIPDFGFRIYFGFFFQLRG